MARGDYPSTKQDQFNLRLPDGMRDRIAVAAAKSGRSMNAEIVHRLANSLDFPNFEDAGLDLDEDLNFDLMHAASLSGRSLRDEMIFRLELSLNDALIDGMQSRTWRAERKAEGLEKLFLQLTPEERMILEERAEIVEHAKDYGFKAKDVGRLCQLRKIGGKGRINIRIPRPGAEFILRSELGDDAHED